MIAFRMCLNTYTHLLLVLSFDQLSMSDDYMWLIVDKQLCNPSMQVLNKSFQPVNLMQPTPFIETTTEDKAWEANFEYIPNRTYLRNNEEPISINSRSQSPQSNNVEESKHEKTIDNQLASDPIQIE